MPINLIPGDTSGWYENIRVTMTDVDCLLVIADIEISASPGNKPFTLTFEDVARSLFTTREWLIHVAECQLPAECIVEDDFLFWAGALSEDRIDFRITTDLNKGNDARLLFKAMVKRKPFVKNFVKAFKNLLRRNHIHFSTNDPGLGDPNEISYDELLLRLHKS